MIRVIIFLYLFSSGAYAWTPFGSNNYNDCILENIKGAQSPQAVFAVKKACRSKFPSAEACEDLEKIQGQGLTFAQIRQLPGFENISDDEIIAHGQSIGIDTSNIIAEKKCKDLYKNTK